MPRRTSYLPGVPNWVSLQTSVPAVAKSFYGRLFGWEFDGPTATKNDGTVAAVTEWDTDPRWTTYLNVEDLDAAVAEVERAGGLLLTPPSEDDGRTALVADPAGVTIGLWQAGEDIGATLVNEPGTFIWSELMTDRRDAVLPFYERVFGLTTTTIDLDGAPYTAFVAGGEMIGGIIPPQREGADHRWIVHFAVESVEEAVSEAVALGGSVVHGPISTPLGPLAALHDPDGAAFSVWAFDGPASRFGS